VKISPNKSGSTSTSCPRASEAIKVALTQAAISVRQALTGREKFRGLNIEKENIIPIAIGEIWRSARVIEAST